MSEHLEILRFATRRCVCVLQARGKTHAFDRLLRNAGNHLGWRNADQLQQRRHQIAGVAEPVADLAARRQRVRPGDHQRIANAAAMGVLLVAAQRRVRRHRPAMREVGVGVGAADVVDAPHLLRNRLGLEIVRAHRVDEAQRPAFLAGAVVGEHQHQRVVENAGGLEERDQPRQMPVGMIEHRRECRLQPREHAPLVGAVLAPRLHAVVARRQPRVGRHQPHLLLPREASLALDVPSFAEDRIVLHDQLARRLMRRVAGAERDPGQPRLIGPCRDVLGDEADRLIDQILGEVIAALIRSRRRDAGVVADQLRRILVGLGIHEAVVAIESAPERPAVERAGRARFGQRRDMPFAEHVVAIAVRPQHLGDRSGLLRDLAAIAGIAAVEIGEAADADGVVIASGQQRRARRRAHRRGVKA